MIIVVIEVLISQYIFFELQKCSSPISLVSQGIQQSGASCLIKNLKNQTRNYFKKSLFTPNKI